MKHRPQYAILSLIGFVAAAVVLMVMLRPDEPVYNGKPLSFWVDRVRKSGADQAQARQAIRQVGPTAIPFILQQIRHQDPLDQKVYRAVWSKLPGYVQRRLPKPLPEPLDAGRFKHQVASILSSLGQPALPRLRTALRVGNSDVRFVTVLAIGSIGPKAEETIPAVTKLVNDPDGTVRVQAIFALMTLGPNRKTAIPALIAALHDNNQGPKPGHTVYVRECAAFTLGEIGPEARSAIPELTKMLTHTNSYTREAAAESLWRISHDTNMIPILATELNQAPDSETSGRILTCLGEIGPLAKQAVPAILRKFTNSASLPNLSGMDVPLIAIDNLRKVDPDLAQKIESTQKP
jgi:HEAT repeats